MSMYLPNPALQPTGGEAAEFIDVPPLRERPSPPAAGLDHETRRDIARWAEEYIAGLVGTHNGTPDDIRSIIAALQGAADPVL